MKKILVISNFLEQTGYSRMGREIALCLDSIDEFDVAIQNITFGNPRVKCEDRIYELLEKDYKNPDVCLQVTLPQFATYNGNIDKNILYFCWESSHFSNIPLWTEKINLMDECWIPCNEMVQICKRSCVEVPINVVPIPCDPSKYFSYYQPFNMMELEDQFSFYFIGEINERKNLKDLLIAFHLEFDPQEKVQLVIKGNKPGLSPAQTTQYIQELIQRVKIELRLYHNISEYKKEIIIGEDLSDEAMMGLHTTCDCLVAPSKGEAWNLSVFDAMCMGKTPITTLCGGPRDYLMTEGDPAGYLLTGVTEPVLGMESDFYSSRQSWWGIDISQLRQYMRMAYQNERRRKELSMNGVDRSVEYSYGKVGEKIEEILNEQKTRINWKKF